MSLNKMSEGEKFASIMTQLATMNLSIQGMTLIMRELTMMIALKATVQEALVNKAIEKLKKPRTVDEFLANTFEAEKKKKKS